MGIVAIRDSADRMAEDLDRRLGDVLVVVRCTSLAQILEHPGLIFVGLDICFGFDAGDVAKLPESSVRARTSSKEDGIIGARILRYEAFDAGVHDEVHRSV